MYHFATRGKQHSLTRARQISIEALENRQFLSASLITPFDTTEPPVAAQDVSATAGKRFHDVVGSWAVTGGVPAKSSGVIAIAVIDWGDGKTSKGKFVDDGSGVVQITGSHAWHSAGTF